MSKHLTVPPELEHLIEKREAAERRELERRLQERRQLDLGPLGQLETADVDEIELEDRRLGGERRDEAPRRKRSRR
jgi:hypothetical protein